MSDQPDNRARRRERAISFGVIGLLAAALLLSEGASLVLAGKTSTMEGEIAAVRAEAETALAAVIPPQTIDGAARSVYLVTQKIDGYVASGTAFVIDRENGVLATAAHVALMLNFNDPDNPVSIINQHSGKPMRVLARKIHSGFREFGAIVDNYAPIKPDSPVDDPQLAALVSAPFDVALLIVDPIDADTGENLLGPALAIASEETLHNLQAGDVIAMLGYPVDALGAPDYSKGFSSRSERGVIAAVTSPLDTATMPRAPETDTMIVHRMQLIPGNSGGPLLNRSGEVIGVNTLVSFRDSIAQRADMLYDLLQPLREEERLARLYKPDLLARLALFRRAREALPYAFYAAYNRKIGRGGKHAPQTIAEVGDPEDYPFSSFVSDYVFSPASTEYVLLAPDLEDQDTAEAAAPPRHNTNKTRADSLKAFVIDAPGQYSARTLSLPTSRNHAIFSLDFATGMDAASNRVFAACPVELYMRRHGSSEMTGTQFLPIASYFIPAGGRGVSRFDVIVRRVGCKDYDNKFLLGVVSWDEPVSAEKSISLASAGDYNKRSLAATEVLASRFLNAFNCSSPVFADRAACLSQLSATELREPR